MPAAPARAHVMVVDDDADLLRLLSMRLNAAGYRVTAVESAEAALARLEADRPQLVLSDVQLPGLDGLALFDEIRRRHPALPVILLTAHGTIPDAVQATSRGVYTYLTKPYDGKQLLDVIAQALSLTAPAHADPGETEAWRAEIVSRSNRMAELLGEAKLVAGSDASVLLRGESGSGKELLAQAIHRASRRAHKPFVAVNCGAIPEALLESELFGHTKGAFTGAVAHHQGLFQAADGGTLFLDEIGDLPMQAQVKLLRLLQNRESTQVGANTPRFSDVRVVAATHKNLKELVREGKFREDLYFRINVVHVGLPALRERGEDIEVLANYFLKQFSVQVGRTPPAGFAPDALEAMRRYAWPGNIRELENAVHRAVLLSAGPLIAVRDLPPPVRAVMDDHTDEHAALSPRASVTAPALLSAPPPPVSSSSVSPSAMPVESTRGEAPEATLPATGSIDLRQIIEDYENSLIMQAMARTNGNKNRAAQLLGLNRTTLVEMIKRKKLFPINSPHGDKD